MSYKGTKGNWCISTNTNQGIRILVLPNEPVRTTNIASVSGNPSDKEIISNAQLIADAGNVRQQIDCDLPELLEQRNELLEALSKLVEETEDHVANGATDEHHLSTARDMAATAIAKTKS